MRRKKPVGASNALTFLIGSTMLALWLLIMVVVTWITAYLLNLSLTQENEETVQNLIYTTRVEDLASGRYDASEEIKDFWLFDGVSGLSRRSNGVSGGLFRSVKQPVQTACAIYDGKGNLLEKSGNGLYFWYMTEENWYEAMSDRYADGVAIALYDQSDITQTALDVLHTKDIFAMRLTGVIEDGYLTPSKIEYISDNSFYDVFWNENLTGAYERHVLLQEWIDRGVLEWQTFLVSDFSDENEEVYYSVDCHISVYDAGEPVCVEDKEYKNLMGYVEQLASRQGGDFRWAQNSGSLWDRLLCLDRGVYEDPLSENPVLAYRIVAAARFSPMKLAIEGLLYVYIVSFLLFTVVGVVLWSIVRKKTIIPLRAFNSASGKDWGVMAYNGDSWREIKELDQNYSNMRRERERLQDENRRLQVALDYAKEAEINRRQITSAVAHELKTPLAVIHSYTEGLQERIAEEKRERYLDVILSETERLDSLVMEMLDLSRLEAGKVKLSREVCSLSALVESVFQKMECLASEKELQIQLALNGLCEVSMDEGRILQVIENLASNAIRYTAKGGNIWVKTFEDRRNVWCRIENESKPFTQEELSKIWNTFYQTDQTRSGKGTGLGLAICRSIIELHGGICQAENISDGVAFWFRLRK